MSGRASVHTYPTTAAREHVTDSLDCWCKPQFFVPCEECDGEGDCWKCSPIYFDAPDCPVLGLIEIDYEAAARDEVTCIIAHRA